MIQFAMLLGNAASAIQSNKTCAIKNVRLTVLPELTFFLAQSDEVFNLDKAVESDRTS